jgi:bifunctional DNA-binding transcriptional regulator/antitoxin component of YhaV-PrlF toxin-antitoxin module
VPPVAPTRYQTVELGEGGRLVIPAPMRAALEMKMGDKLTVALHGDQLSIYTYDVAIRRVQALMKRIDPENRLTVDNFLRWRREEAAKERAEMDRRSNGDD